VKQIIVILDVEAKDEYEGGAGFEPEGDNQRAEVAAVAQDLLAEYTRSSYDLPWMIRKVTLFIPVST
jgi:hypothetical protein